MALPPKFAETARQIQESQQRYVELARQRKLVRRIYLGFLLLLTVLVLFASTWLALFLSKLVNRPVAAMAAGTEAISRGQLDYRVDIRATDELAELVQSFNTMAEQLESSRRQIEASSRELAAANDALKVVVATSRRFLRVFPPASFPSTENAALPLRMRRFAACSIPSVPNSAHRWRSLECRSAISFPSEVISDFDPLLRRASRMGYDRLHHGDQLAPRQAECGSHRRRARSAAQRPGYVIVFEDLSDLLRAQKQSAWSEVARRVAHEIKNPLTPIALSAERIHRHLTRGSAPDAASLDVIRGCAATIGNAVETVRSLVDEFSVLARFPASRPHPGQPERSGGKRASALQRAAARHSDAHPSCAGPARCNGRSGCDQARRGQPGR